MTPVQYRVHQDLGLDGELGILSVELEGVLVDQLHVADELLGGELEDGKQVWRRMDGVEIGGWSEEDGWCGGWRMKYGWWMWIMEDDRSPTDLSGVIFVRGNLPGNRLQIHRPLDLLVISRNLGEHGLEY